VHVLNTDDNAHNLFRATVLRKLQVVAHALCLKGVDDPILCSSSAGSPVNYGSQKYLYALSLHENIRMYVALEFNIVRPSLSFFNIQL
jgi:hypothetical protein